MNWKYNLWRFLLQYLRLKLKKRCRPLNEYYCFYIHMMAESSMDQLSNHSSTAQLLHNVTLSFK